MRVLLSAAGRAFVRAFAVTFLALAGGIWVAPNLNEAYALAGAASIAAVVAGLRALLVFVPGFSAALAAKLGYGGAGVVVTVITTFVGGLLAVGIDVLSAPDLGGAKLALFAGLIAVGDGIVRAVQAWLTPGEGPTAGFGVPVPAQPIAPASLPPTR